ncbi:hypothetical protein BGZ54_007384 [Gamsiella multidivaricata]|nr:hypothetical protein BGZ54_007384 [Gamsiella multidivaricata]
MAESMGIDLQSPRGELRTAFYNPHEVKRRRRTSRSQFKTLEKAFTENPKPDASTRRHLAQRLSMSPRGIQVWFQNRRAKSKQANATPTVTTNGQSNIPCVITFNRDQLHKHNLPNGALTGVGRLEPQVESELFKNKTQNTDGKLHTSINTPTQQTTFTNGTTSSGMPCAGSTITFLLPSAQLPSKMDSRQFQSISHHSTFSSQRGWDDHLHASSLGTQGQASSAYIGQHPLELQQSNYAEDVAKGPLDSNKMVSAIPSTESSISSSVETTELVQGTVGMKGIRTYL